MPVNNLLAVETAVFYAERVTDDQFWRAVGAEFARRRERAGYGSTFTFYRANRGAPAIGTLDAIEAGRPGRIENIQRYGDGLGVTIADVVRTVLAADESGGVSTDERDLIALHRELEAAGVGAQWRLVGEGLKALHPRTAGATPPRRGRSARSGA